MKEDDLVEVIEVWSKHDSLYEMMLREDFNKKMAGQPYNTLRTSNTAPWVEFGEEREAPWTAQSTLRTKRGFEAILDERSEE